MTSTNGRRHRLFGPATVVVLLLVVAAIPFLPPLRVEASWTSMIRDHEPLLGAQDEIAERFGAGGLIVIVVTGEAPVPAEVAEALATEVATWPEVQSAVGPSKGWNVPDTVAPDGTSAAVYVEAGKEHCCGEGVRRFVERLEAWPRPAGVRILAAGPASEEVEIARTLEEDMSILVPATLVALVIVGWILLGSLGGAIALFLTIGVVLLLTSATNGLLYGPLTTVTNLVVPIVMTIAAANVVHFAARFRRDRRSLPADEAFAVTMRQGGKACLVASLTTGAGFLALLVIQIPSFTRLAILGAMGCFWTWVVVVGLLPTLLRLLDRRIAKVRAGFGLLLRIARRDLIRRGWLSFAWIGLLLLVGTGVVHLTSRTRAIDLMPAHTDFTELSSLLDEDLGGSAYLDVLWKTEGETFRSAEGLARIREAEAALSADVHRVRSVVGAASAVALVQQALPDLPDTTALAALETGEGRKLPRWIDESGQAARITLRLPGGTTQDLIDAAEEAEAVLARVVAPGDEVAVAGTPRLVAEAVEAIVAGQALACLISVALVSILATIWLRSWWSLPVIWTANLIPLVGLAGLLGWMGQPVSVSTAVVGSVVFGLVVDDTLHFLFALKEEGRGRHAAQRALKRLGPAFVATTFVLLTGALISAFGRMPGVAVFGRLMAIGVTLGLMCDLFIAPRVAARLCRRKAR